MSAKVDKPSIVIMAILTLALFLFLLYASQKATLSESSEVEGLQESAELVTNVYLDMGYSVDLRFSRQKESGKFQHIGVIKNTSIEVLAYENNGEVEIVYPTKEVQEKYHYILTKNTKQQER